HLGGERRALARALETDLSGTRPGYDRPVHVGDGHDRVVEARLHVGDAVGADPALAFLGLLDIRHLDPPSCGPPRPGPRGHPAKPGRVPRCAWWPGVGPTPRLGSRPPGRRLGPRHGLSHRAGRLFGTLASARIRLRALA